MSTFRLDGKPIPFTKGQTIMEAALAAGEYIPHLCHNPEFTPHGSCRVCVVQNKGQFMSSCTQPAQPDMDIDNSSTQVNDYRKSLLQMLFVEGNHVCPGCEKSGACQLQAVAYYVGMLTPRFTHFFPRRELDASHKEIAIDFNRCILCELCVRASRDVDGKNIFAINGRGLDAHLSINSPTGKLADSSLSVNDKAVQVCPVGAILPKNQGYDTPVGKRLYDRQPVSVVGDVAANGNDKHD